MLKRKYYRHIFSDTLLGIKIVKLNIFPRPEEAMFDNWQKIVSLYKYLVLFLRKLNLHDVKQNEKYPYAKISSLIICNTTQWHTE